jgi:predicted Holliday junction resolvase-like endonuclease
MNTYLVWSSIVLHILIFLVVIAVTIDEIRTRKENKQLVAEFARKKAAYQEELKLAEPVWQEWQTKYEDLERAYQKETDLHKRLHITSEKIRHSHDSYYYFTSTSERKSLCSLAIENKWILQEKSSQQAG